MAAALVSRGGVWGGKETINPLVWSAPSVNAMFCPASLFATVFILPNNGKGTNSAGHCHSWDSRTQDQNKPTSFSFSSSSSSCHLVNERTGKWTHISTYVCRISPYVCNVCPNCPCVQHCSDPRLLIKI